MTTTTTISQQRLDVKFDQVSGIARVWNLCTPEELYALNLRINRKRFVYQNQSKDGTQSVNFHHHKCTNLLVWDSLEAMRLTKRLFRLVNDLNFLFWQFDYVADFDRLHESLGTVFNAAPQAKLADGSEPHPDVGFLINQYGPGDHIDRHVDYMPKVEKVCHRRLVFVMQLTDPALYRGGRLLLRRGDSKLAAPLEAGSAVIFPAYTQHEVEHVRAGIRWSMTAFLFDAYGRRFT